MNDVKLRKSGLVFNLEASRGPVSPETTNICVYVCVSPGEKARNFIISSKHKEPNSPITLQGAEAICPRLGCHGFKIHCALRTSKGLTFPMAGSKLEKCACVFK